MIRIFSGTRPSGKLHLGNYLGAIKNWINLQHTADQAIFAVVDLHGITTPFDPKTYRQNVYDVILDYLAAGVDPEKSLLIRQSRVPHHAELAWIFNTITPISWLDRLPNYREKVEQVDVSGDERAQSYQNNLSLLAYPVLMAADILLYKSNLVPVGDDQKQHLDLTNEVAGKFNYLFGNTFPAVKAHAGELTRIMSLGDPHKKMSKTGDEGISLTDHPDDVVRKIKRATTDSGKDIMYDPVQKPGISNLLIIDSMITEQSIDQVLEKYTGLTYADFKMRIADTIITFLRPFQDRRAELSANMDYVESVLVSSEEAARAIAETTIQDVREKMGL